MSAATVITDTKKDTQLKKFDKASAQVKKIVTELAVFNKIETKEQSDKALVTMKSAKEVEKLIEDKRVELVSPYNEKVKSINAYAKDLMKQISDAIVTGKNAVLVWQKEEQAKALQLLKEARVKDLLALGMEETETTYQYETVSYFKSLLGIDDATWKAQYDIISQQIERLKNDKLKQLTEVEDLVDIFGTDDDKAEVKEEIKKVATHVPAFGSRVSNGRGSSYSAPEKVKGTTTRWKFEITDESLVPREYTTSDSVKIRAAVTAGTRTIPGVRIYEDESITLR